MKYKNFLLPILLLFVTCGEATVPPDTRDSMDKTVETTIQASFRALERAVAEVQDTLAYPTYAKRDNLKWRLKSSRNWVSGFWP